MQFLTDSKQINIGFILVNKIRSISNSFIVDSKILIKHDLRFDEVDHH